MKAKILLIALALFAGQASAEWELISVSDDSDYFIDRSTIRNQNGYTLAWILENYTKPKTVDGLSYSSALTLEVAKCGEFLSAIKSSTKYIMKNGKGDSVTSYKYEFNQLDFRDVAPGTVRDYIYNAICGIK